MNYWWISDTHFSHENIIKYCNRPFKNIGEMDKTLIKNWNQRVKPEDTVFELGDFNFHNSKNGKKGEGTIVKARDYEKRLNGKIIHIVGNHTRNNGCKTIIENLVIRYGGERIFCVHNPAHFNDNYRINFIGHVHNTFEIKRIITKKRTVDLINVGVDVWDFRPVSFNQIMSRYAKFKKGYGLNNG